MPKYFAAMTVPPGFFNEKPDDMETVEISDEQWRDMIDAQSNGKMISVDKNGQPVAISLPVIVDDETTSPADQAQ